MDNDDVWLGDQLPIANPRNLIKKGHRKLLDFNLPLQLGIGTWIPDLSVAFTAQEKRALPPWHRQAPTGRARLPRL